MSELYEKVHATEDRAERRRLKEEYRIKLQHLHEDQLHHPHMPDDDVAQVKVQTIF